MPTLRRADLDPSLLAGKRILITGANSGIGRATAELCAAAGAHVVLTARRPERGEAAVADLKARHPQAQVHFVPLDLDRPESIDACARAVLENAAPLDALVNNAGGMADGTLARMFVGNVLGPFQLTERLLPALLARRGKVVNVSSAGHRMAVVPRNDESLEALLASGRGSSIGRYGFTKLCNIWHVIGLHRLHHAAGLRTYALHPGGIATEGFDKTDGLPWYERAGSWLYKRVFAEKDISLGAQTTMHCLANRGADAESGRYYDNCAGAPAQGGDDHRRVDELFALCGARLSHAD